MLTVLFFMSVFSSLVWFIYAGLFVHTRFETVDMSSIDAYTLALYVGLVVIPVWIVWQVFGFINQYFKTKSTDKKLEQLYTQMKKNQDYTDLVVRVMLDAEHEIKDGFVVGKFDIFVADMNEILADIAQRSNAASSVKLGELWTRVKNGERWIIAKTFIENAKAHADFDAYLKDKAERDSVFKGTLLEFCARYQNLSDMLEKHDRDRIFITILQTGVMGKVYAMLSPIALDLTQQKKEPVKQVVEEPTFEISPSIEKMQAPDEPLKSAPSVAKKENQALKKDSIFKKVNLFGKKKKQDNEGYLQSEDDDDDDETFFATLQQRMQQDEASSEPVLKAKEEQELDNEPHFEASNFEDTQDEDDISLSLKEMSDNNAKTLEAFLDEPALSVPEDNQKEDDSEESENLAYPFGGWTDSDEKA